MIGKTDNDRQSVDGRMWIALVVIGRTGTCSAGADGRFVAMDSTNGETQHRLCWTTQQLASRSIAKELTAMPYVLYLYRLAVTVIRTTGKQTRHERLHLHW